jgi:hypothetical protein
MSQATPPTLQRAVPVNAEPGARRRVMGATDWWFYPLIVLIAAGLVSVSLGGEAFIQAATPQHAAARTGAELVYGPHELARGSRMDADHVRYVVRDFGVSARAVRLAVRPGTPAPTPQSTGVMLLLDPAETAPLSGKPVRVVLALRRFSVTAAGGIAVSLQNGGPVQWVIVPLPTVNGDVTVDLPPLDGAPATALGLRMLSDIQDYNHGAEITRITLKPAG